MYKSYNKLTKELSLAKSKFYTQDVYHDYINHELADDMRKFFEEDFIKGDLPNIYLDYLKECFKEIGTSVGQTLRIADTDVLKVNLSGLLFYNVKVLLTYEGDPRNIEKLKQTWHSTNVDQDGFKKFSYLDNNINISDGDYFTIMAFPVPSKNGTWKIYSDKFSDRDDGREFYFRLTLKQAPGLYVSTKAKKPVLILHNKRAKFTFEKKKQSITIIDSNAREDGKKFPVDLMSILPYLYFNTNISNKSEENYKQHIASLMDEPLYFSIMGKYGQLKQPKPELIERLNKTSFLDDMMEDISDIDGIQALTNVVGYTLSRDSGSVKAGTVITEENKNLLDISKPVFVKCGLPIDTIIDDVTVPIRCAACAVYYDDDFERTTIEQYQVKGLTTPSGSDFTLKMQKVTPIVQKILFNSNQDSVQTTGGTIYLERPIFVTPINKDNLFYVALNIISLLKSVVAMDKVTNYNLLELRSSFNRYVYTPRMIIEDGINYVWKNLFTLYKNKIANQGLVYRTSLWEILKDDTMVENPIGIMNKCVIQKLRKYFFKKNILDYVTTQAMINPIQYASCLKQVDIKTKDENSVAFEDRQLHPSMFGRVDMFEVPLGPKLGLTTHLTIGCEIGTDGAMNVKYLKVENGQITNQVVKLKAIEEHNYVISSMTDLDIDDNGRILNTKKVFAKVQSRFNKWNVDIALVNPSEVQLVSYSPDSEFSWSVSCVPFVGNNDSARVTYGVAQLKQAKSLIIREAPIVRTRAWRTIPKIQDVFSTIRTISNTKFCVPQINQSQHSLNIQYHKGTYNLTKEAFSNVESSMIKDGTVCVGRNALVAYIPDGSTYEDSVHVADCFADKLFSYRLDEYESDRYYLKRRDGDEVNSFPTTPPIYSRSMQRRVLQSGDSVCNINDLGKNVVYKSSKEALLMRVSHHSKELKETTKVEHTIEYDVLKVNRLECGDKLSNRHANKGVLSFSSPSPRIGSLSNGMELDIIYNSLGVISRMNLGQLYEAQVGLIGKVLGVNILVNVISGITQDDVLDLMKMTYDLVNSKDNFDLEVSKWASISQDLVEELKKNKIQIQSWEGVFDERGCAEVEGIHGKVVIGIMYVNKLTQESETKMGVRGGVLSNETYVNKTQEPVRGAKVDGGQRVGNMEVDAYMAYGADDLLRSLYNKRGNNVKRRIEYINEVLHKDYHKTQTMLKPLLDIRGSSAEFICTMKALGIDIESDTQNSLADIVKCTKLDAKVKERFLYGVKSVESNSGLDIAKLVASSKHPQIIEIEHYLKTQGLDWEDVKRQLSPIGGTIEDKILHAIFIWETDQRSNLTIEPKDLIIKYRLNEATWANMEDLYQTRILQLKTKEAMTSNEFVGVSPTEFSDKPLVEAKEQRIEKVSKNVDSMELIGTYELEDLFG